LQKLRVSRRAHMCYHFKMIALPKIPIRMTVAEFFAWTPPTADAWQLVDAEPQAMAWRQPASRMAPSKPNWGG
jgi:hypothetical protein